LVALFLFRDLRAGGGRRLVAASQAHAADANRRGEQPRSRAPTPYPACHGLLLSLQGPVSIAPRALMGQPPLGGAIVKALRRCQSQGVLGAFRPRRQSFQPPSPSVSKS